MTTNHTPGPWSTHLVDSTVVVIPRRPFPQQISTLGHSEVADEQDYANARLIAAAPDYHDAAGWILAAVATNAAPVNALAALEEMALDGKHVTLDAGLVLDLLKAHAKAKGEQQ